MLDAIRDFYLQNQTIISYISIPFISGFIGWFTNMVALKMTFYPLRYKGIPGFWKIPPVLGWQGIIPRKAGKMATISVDIITEKLMPVEEIYSRLDPRAMSKELKPIMGEVSDDIVEEIGNAANSDLWQMTPKAVKEEIQRRVSREAPRMMSRVLDELRSNIQRIFDVRGLVVKNLTGRNVKNMVDMFQKVGGPEFTFIEMSGLYFGFIFGLFQMAIFALWDEGILLPICGVIVGYATNWLALRMIFRPQQPTKYGPFTYQGLFHKRQDSVSKEYARLVATQILSARQITNYVMFGKQADTFFDIVTRNIGKAVDGMNQFSKPAAVMFLGEERYNELRENIIEKLRHSVPTQARAIEEYMDRALDLSNTMYTRLRSLPPMEFERILRTAFQEDELLLILVGAALGAMAGLLQWVAFFW